MKQIPADEEHHRALKALAKRSGKKLYAVIEEAFDHALTASGLQWYLTSHAFAQEVKDADDDSRPLCVDRLAVHVASAKAYASVEQLKSAVRWWLESAGGSGVTWDAVTLLRVIEDYLRNAQEAAEYLQARAS